MQVAKVIVPSNQTNTKYSMANVVDVVAADGWALEGLQSLRVIANPNDQENMWSPTQMTRKTHDRQPK